MNTPPSLLPSRRSATRVVAVLLVALAALAWPGASARAQEMERPQLESPSAPADTSEARRVEILRADSLAGVVEQGSVVRRLVGDVRLLQGETRLRSDRATQYLAADEILFTGNVLIVEDGDSLTADQVRYDTAEKVGRATGNVRLADGEVVVRGPAGEYFANEKRATFLEGVTLIDSASTLESRQGEYFTDEKRAEFYGDVRLTGERTVLDADSVTYLRADDVSIARGRVAVERLGESEDEEVAEADTSARTFLFGRRVYNDEKNNFSRATGDALLVQLRADSSSEGAAGAAPDTLLLSANELETSRQDTLRRLTATGGVRIWQKDLAAVADSAVYDEHRRPRAAPDSSASDSTAAERRETRLYRSPLAWTEDAQLSGDTIRITGRGESIDTLFAHQNAFLAQRDSVLGKIQQLKGQRLVGFFEDDSLRHLTAGPNAEAVRFLVDDAGAANGAVRASSDVAEFWVRGGAVRRVKFDGGVQGTQFLKGNVPEPLRLDGFAWSPERRPTRVALLQDARIRERLREHRLPLPEEPEAPEDVEAPPALPAEARPAPANGEDASRGGR